jgi:hypothetical protein
VDGEQSGARYGHAVATAGDVNGDGYSDIIVGARFQSGGEADEGRAYVYYGGPDTLSATSDEILEGGQADAHLGPVAIGDLNGDGWMDTAWAAPDYDHPDDGDGKVFVAYGSDGTQGEFWIAHGDQAGARFGASLGMADVNGDGYADLLVGAPSYTNGQVAEGKVFVYLGSSSGLSFPGTPANADWSMESNIANARFGAAVRGAGDVDGDGYADMIVGAPGYNITGAAYLYCGSASGLWF